MNPLAHFMITYIVLDAFIPNCFEYILPIAFFSMVLDIDHLPGFLKLFHLPKTKVAKLTVHDMVNMFRSAVQEPIGIFTIEMLLAFLYIYGVNDVLLSIASVAIFTHWLVDFFTVHTKPFVPLDDRIVCFFFKTERQRAISELVITIISTVVFLIIL